MSGGSVGGLGERKFVMATRWYRDATEEEAGLGLRLPNLLKFPVRAMDVSVVPWCASHDSRMQLDSSGECDWRWGVKNRYVNMPENWDEMVPFTSCRLEEPARHYVEEQHD